MNIIVSWCRLNRFFRRSMTEHGFEVDTDLEASEKILNDIDNLYAGCAFE